MASDPFGWGAWRGTKLVTLAVVLILVMAASLVSGWRAKGRERRAGGASVDGGGDAGSSTDRSGGGARRATKLVTLAVVLALVAGVSLVWARSGQPDPVGDVGASRPGVATEEGPGGGKIAVPARERAGTGTAVEAAGDGDESQVGGQPVADTAEQPETSEAAPPATPGAAGTRTTSSGAGRLPGPGRAGAVTLTIVRMSVPS
jgi:hypothetical protein